MNGGMQVMEDHKGSLEKEAPVSGLGGQVRPLCEHGNMERWKTEEEKGPLSIAGRGSATHQP